MRRTTHLSDEPYLYGKINAENKTSNIINEK